MKHSILWLLAGVVLCCQTAYGQSSKKPAEMQVKISSVTKSDQLDTLYVNFKLLDRDGKKKIRQGLLKGDASDFIKVTEDSKESVLKVLGIRDIRTMRTRMRDKTICLLMDRTSAIPGDVIGNQRKVVERIIETFDSANIFLSFMENGTIKEVGRITSDTRTYKNEFTADECKGEKLLFTSVMSKLREMSETMDSTGEKYLFVFTDGEIYDQKGKAFGGDEEYEKSRAEYLKWMESVRMGEKENIPVFCFYMNPEGEGIRTKIRSRLELLSSPKGPDDREGRFFEVLNTDSLSMLMMRTLDTIAPDYQLVLENQVGRRYDGTRIIMGMEITHPDVLTAYGESGYAFCSPQNPCTVESPENGKSSFPIILGGLFWGLIVLGLSYLIMQLAIPAISAALFEQKYKKEYTEGRNAVKCYICKQPITSNQLVTTQCNHRMHWRCWESEHGLCPQCSKGDHYYNKEKPWATRNALSSMKWILWGLMAGLASWLCLRLCWIPGTFGGIFNSLTGGDSALKLQENLLGGIILGFFIVFGLGFALEYHKKSLKIVGRIALRALAGALMGFIAFFIGNIILAMAGQYDKCWWLDWIPWMLFSIAIAAIISFRTEVKFTKALVGGLIAILCCYALIYSAKKDPFIMISYMFYAAGLGGAIYAVHSSAEHFFLRFVHGDTDKKIAIHKWMKASGGMNHVTIGANEKCTIQMNWDKSESIADKAVELYLIEELPYMKVLSDNVTRQGRIIKKGTELALHDGDEFSIGRTRFSYIENNENK